MMVIGIDPGSCTGWAHWDTRTQKLMNVCSMLIHQALQDVDALARSARSDNSPPPLVIFEDARRRRWFGVSGPEKWQGAGSIKRDSTIWEDFLIDLEIPFIASAPGAAATKWTSEYFERITGWPSRTNEHARDAAGIVYGTNEPMAQSMVRVWQQNRAAPKQKPARTKKAKPAPDAPTPPHTPPRW